MTFISLVKRKGIRGSGLGRSENTDVKTYIIHSFITEQLKVSGTDGTAPRRYTMAILVYGAIKCHLLPI